jgi:DNA/RNA-binding domain of Phe-tRNA-synthetase-like protein
MAAGTSTVPEDDPHVEAWRTAYRAFGTNPKRVRPSVDALRRRLARSGRLPRINPAVDCYNLISVISGVPAGAFDPSGYWDDDPMNPAGEFWSGRLGCPFFTHSHLARV